MPRFEIKVSHRPDIKVPTFSAAQMGEIGAFAEQVIKERVAGQVDVLDQPAKPLQPKYAKRKAAKGLRPVRDLRFTGNMLGSIHVHDATASHVTVKVDGATPYRKGIFNQNIDPWFGVSNNDDQRIVKEKLGPMFAQNLKDML